jgi:signal transduction histidine kinase
VSAKILVAEDEVGIRIALTILLEEEGYQVSTACDGNEAISVVRGKEFDLVISDIRMPGMSGLQFLEEVNKTPSAPDMILMTAFGSVETAIQAMKKGARDFLIKPFSNDLLKMTVKRVLERRELSDENRKLHELEKLKNEFIAMIAHELRTPLTAIKGYLSLVLSESAGDLRELQKKYLRVVNQNSEKLQRIVEEVLDIAQMDKSEFHLNTVPSNLFTIIGKAVAVLQEAVAEKDIKLEVNFDAAAGPILVDRQRFKQVMVALLENAVAFSQAHRGVWINVRPWAGADALLADGVPCSYVDFLSLAPGDYLEISVEDEGPGIPKEALSEVFKKFYQVEDLYVRQVGGMGLGLTLCKRLVETMGGRIWVKSQPGQGSRFSFILPWKKGLEKELRESEENALASLPAVFSRTEG